MSDDNRHDYRDLMKENGCNDFTPAPHSNFSDILKLLLGGLVILQIIIWVIT